MGPSTEPKTPWYDRNLASAIAGGLIVAAVVWGAPQAISLISKTHVPWWVYLLIAGVVLALVTVVIPALRRGIWGNLAAAIRLLGTVRVTTTKRLKDRDVAAVARGSAAMEAKTRAWQQLMVSGGKLLGVSTLATQKDLDQAKAIRDLAEQESAGRHKKELRQEYERGWKDGKEATQPAKSPLPPPAPRWTLIQMASKGRERTFRVKNLMPGSVANNVRMETREGNVVLWQDAAFWPDLSGEATGDFKVKLTDAGSYSAFTFRMSWLDEFQKDRNKDFTVPSSEKDPNDVWNLPGNYDGGTPF